MGAKKGRTLASSRGKKSPGKAIFEIRQVLRECIGCGACSAVSRNWKAKGEKFVPRETLLGRLGKELEAAESCPVNCIHVFDRAKKKKLI